MTMRYAIGMVTALAAALTAAGQEWTRFRGPNGSGIGKAAGLPATWTEEDIRWKVKLPGTGHGSAVLWGQRVYTAVCDNQTGRRMLCCLDAGNGGTVWTKLFGGGKFHLHRDNSYAVTTPTVDAERIVVGWGSPRQVQVVSLDHAGNEQWTADLGRHKSQHGASITPLLHGGRVFVQNDQQGESSIAALDAKTGKVLWKVPRGSGKTSYGTPCIRNAPDGAEQLIVTSKTDGITALDPASGEILWQAKDAQPARTVGSPVLAGELVLSCCGTGKRGIRMVAVRPEGEAAKVVYDMRAGSPYVPTPLLVDGKLYLFGDTGTLTCLEAQSGKKIWQEKVKDRFYGSPVLADGKIWCIARSGKVYVLAPGGTFDLLAVNDLGEKSSATPAVALGSLFLRTYSHVIRVGGEAK